MNLFAALDKTHYYPLIVKLLLPIFQYDYTNIVFVMALYKSEQVSITKAVKEKKSNKNMININPLNMMKFDQLNLFSQKKDDEEMIDEGEDDDDDQQDSQNLDEAQLSR